MFGDTRIHGSGGRPRHRLNTLMGGLALSVAALVAMTAAVFACTVTSISVTNDCFSTSTSGILTADGTAGYTVTLEVYAHDTNTSQWVATGAKDTVTMVTNKTSYPYTISGIASEYFGSPYNLLRVGVSSTNPSGAFGGTSVTSSNYSACTPPVVAESPLAVALPLAGLLLVAGFFSLAVVRRRHGASV
jgi:hypothetical protein